jgi:uncharacterized protein YdaU (DUF1376 family)
VARTSHFSPFSGFVPPDVSQLARITGFSEPEFEKLWVTVGTKFDCNERGLFNNRLEDHRKEAQRLREARTLGATLANEKRRARRHAEHSSTDVPQEDAERTHTYTSTSTSQEEKKPRARSARAQRVSRETDFYDENFLRFKLAMPDRVGGHGWSSTKRVWDARLREGEDPEKMIAGAERYANFAAVMIHDKQYVMQAKKFLGPDKWYLEDWEVPPEGAREERWTPPADDVVDPP